jgi:hypothetical protein
MTMQLALRPCVAAAGVAVVSAGLIHITPVISPHIEQRGVSLAAGESLSDVGGTIDAVVGNLSGLGGELSNVLPSLGDLSATSAEGAASQATLELLDPAFWQLFFYDLSNPDSGDAAWLLLTEAVEQLPVIGPLLWSFAGLVVLPLSLLLAGIWSEISQIFGLEPYAAAAEGLGTGLHGVYDAGLAGVIDSAGLVQDVSTALDPSTFTSALDLNPIADIGTAVDAAGLADVGSLLDISTVPDLGEVLTSLVP